MGFLKELFETAKYIVDITKETKEEIGEILTDGFKEIVIKGNNDYKTSHEKRDEAYNIVYNAESKYERVYKDVSNTYEKVSNLLKEHHSYKVNLYGEIKQVQAPLINEYINKLDNIKRTTKAKEGKLSFTDVSFLSNIGSNIMPMSQNNLDFFRGSILRRKRVEEANGLLEDARTIRAEINAECEKLNRVKSNLQLVNKTIEEERSLIERFVKPYKDKIMNMGEILDHGNFTNENVIDIENSINILMLLEKTLTTQFLQDEAKITNQYQLLTKKLRDLESQLSKKEYGDLSKK
jgi:hypothetical protein